MEAGAAGGWVQHQGAVRLYHGAAGEDQEGAYTAFVPAAVLGGAAAIAGDGVHLGIAHGKQAAGPIGDGGAAQKCSTFFAGRGVFARFKISQLCAVGGSRHPLVDAQFQQAWQECGGLQSAAAGVDNAVYTLIRPFAPGDAHPAHQRFAGLVQLGKKLVLQPGMQGAGAIVAGPDGGSSVEAAGWSAPAAPSASCHRSWSRRAPGPDCPGGPPRRR